MTAYDAIIIGTGQAGPALARRLAGRWQEGRAHRAQAGGRHLRQHRLHANQGHGRQRLCRPPRPPRRRLRRRRRRHHGRHEARQGAQGRGHRCFHARRRAVAAHPRELHGPYRPCAATLSARGRGRQRGPAGGQDFPQCRRARHERRASPASIRSLSSPTARWWTSTSCRAICWSSARRHGLAFGRCTAVSGESRVERAAHQPRGRDVSARRGRSGRRRSLRAGARTARRALAGDSSLARAGDQVDAVVAGSMS